jgi:hypothetical protein
MKRYISLSVLATGLMHAAAEQSISKNNFCKECIAREAAQLPLPVERVLFALTSPAVQSLEGKSVEIEICSDLGVERSSVLLLKTSLGKCYKKLATKGFNTTLTSNREVVEIGNTFFVAALKKCPLQILLNANMFDEDLMGCKSDAQAEADPELIREHLPTYVKTVSGHLVEIMNSHMETKVALIPGIENVIRDNADKQLSKKDLITYMGGQLATAFSLRLQLKRNKQIFEEKFAAFLQEVPSAQSE